MMIFCCKRDRFNPKLDTTDTKCWFWTLPTYISTQNPHIFIFEERLCSKNTNKTSPTIAGNPWELNKTSIRLQHSYSSHFFIYTWSTLRLHHISAVWTHTAFTACFYSSHRKSPLNRALLFSVFTAGNVPEWINKSSCSHLNREKCFWSVCVYLWRFILLLNIQELRMSGFFYNMILFCVCVLSCADHIVCFILVWNYGGQQVPTRHKTFPFGETRCSFNVNANKEITNVPKHMLILL